MQHIKYHQKRVWLWKMILESAVSVRWVAERRVDSLHVIVILLFFLSFFIYQELTADTEQALKFGCVSNTAT